MRWRRERVEGESDDVFSSWREGRTKSGKDFTIDCSCEVSVCAIR